MDDVPRRNDPTNETSSDAPPDDPAPDDVADESSDIEPVPEEIGEGDTNLRDRNAALRRRRGGERPAP